ncbi:hypothetical protein R9208_17840 [Flammeovirgaceae bacterium SG7u.132]|nr:hypothetical protein [Flammeovirgaceae bacterium SG7u.132]
MNFKEHQSICLLHAPPSFEEVAKELSGLASVTTQAKEGGSYDFVIAFALSCAEIASIVDSIEGKLAEDAVLWIAYSKKSSKKYTSDISRENGWQPLGDMGFEGVRQVAIDEDWSALRFRDARFIKTMKREKLRAMSEEGKKRIK